MKYTPEPKNKKTEVAAVASFLTSVVLLYFGGQSYTKGRGAVQALGVLCLAISGFFIIKKLKSYSYSITPSEEDAGRSVSELLPSDLTFSVYASYGKGTGNLTAQLDLGDLKEAVALPAKYSEKQRVLKGLGKMQLYYYTVTFLPPESTLLVFEKDGGVRTGIVIEPDGDMKGFFEEAARINAKNE
ncbi:MAG: hypothetical protein IJT70_07345 [Clostridia bacterium]|nr:hypothetical protein [Clostridia bacterium]